MTSIRFVTLDVFTDTRYEGNPLAVCLLPAGLDITQEQLQAIAVEFNLSETVFLLESQPAQSDGVPTWQFRIFIKSQEITFAGHPTIGTASYIFSALTDSSQIRLLCKAGPINLHKDSDGRTVHASIPHDFHIHSQHPVSFPDVLALQPRLQRQEINAMDLISPVNGMTFLAVELSSLQSLAKVASEGVKLDLARDEGWDSGYLGSAFFVGMDHSADVSRYRTRMLDANTEDSATGSMSCALATHLALGERRRHAKFEFTQGVEMGRKSEIKVEVKLDQSLTRCEEVILSGMAVRVMEGTLLL